MRVAQHQTTTTGSSQWVSHSVMGSSNRKIIIWGPLPVYNQRCKSPSHLFAFSFWLRPQWISANLNLNWDWFLWQRALSNKGWLYLSCAEPEMQCHRKHDGFDSREGLSQVSCLCKPVLIFPNVATTHLFVLLPVWFQSVLWPLSWKRILN